MKPIAMFLFMVIVIAVVQLAYSKTTSKSDPYTELETRETEIESTGDVLSRNARIPATWICNKPQYKKTYCTYYRCLCWNGGHRNYCKYADSSRCRYGYRGKKG